MNALERKEFYETLFKFGMTAFKNTRDAIMKITMQLSKLCQILLKELIFSFFPCN